MKYKHFLGLGIALAMLLAVIGVALAQEGPLNLFRVDPPEGRPGEFLDLFLYGSGFNQAQIQGVEVEGIEVREFWVENDELMGASVFIPEFAPPGPRTIMVFGSMGQNEPVRAVLEGGFLVLEAEQVPPGEGPPEEVPPEEIPPDEGPFGPEDVPPEVSFPWWILILLVVGGLGIGGGAAVALTLTLRRASLKETWQEQAQSQELPKDCHPSTYINRREKIELKPGRWKVTGLKVTLYDSAKKERGKTYALPDELVSKIDKAARLRLLHGEGDALRDRIGELAEELSALAVAWQIITEGGKDVYVEAHLEGGTAQAKFARYYCVGQPGSWKKVLEWTAKLTATDHSPASFRAPLEGESQQAYQVFLEQKLIGYLVNLVKEAARLL